MRFKFFNNKRINSFLASGVIIGFFSFLVVYGNEKVYKMIFLKDFYRNHDFKSALEDIERHSNDINEHPNTSEPVKKEIIKENEEIKSEVREIAPPYFR